MKSWHVRVFLAAVTLVVFTHGTDSFKSEDASSRFRRQISRIWNSGALSDLGIPRWWKNYKNGPYGVVIRGWQFSKCASEQWTNYKANVTELKIWPQYPRFPGPIFFNITATVIDKLPTDRIEVELEVRHAVKMDNGEKGWQVIPCQGWDITDGCGGVGSCRYCDVLDTCRKTAHTAEKYATTAEAKEALSKPHKFCPPPLGTWTMTFSQVYKVQDIPKGLFGPMQSNEYWLTFTFTDGRGTPLGCARVWMDVCKYHLYDEYQRCVRDPNAFRNFINEISEHAQQLRNGQRG